MTCQLCKRELTPDETVWRCSVSGSYWKLPKIASLCAECRNKVLCWISAAYTAKYEHGRQRQQVFKNESEVFAESKVYDSKVKAWWESLSVEAQRAEMLVFVLRNFRAAEPCANCQRPVRLERLLKGPPKHLVCGDECRQAVYCRAMLMRRRKTPMPATCEGCAARFTPPRSDAKWCSPACRQRAYRQRLSQAGL